MMTASGQDPFLRVQGADDVDVTLVLMISAGRGTPPPQPCQNQGLDDTKVLELYKSYSK